MPPPEKLFIYEIEGRVYPPDDLTGEDFLGCWREGGYSYLFFPRPMEAAFKAWVATQEGARYSSESVMNYADWEAGQPLMKTSMAGFHLCPVWEDPAPAAGELVIRMEPGLAFGSGFHPTTRTCLTLLRRVYEADAPQRVLDGAVHDRHAARGDLFDNAAIADAFQHGSHGRVAVGVVGI